MLYIFCNSHNIGPIFSKKNYNYYLWKLTFNICLQLNKTYSAMVITEGQEGGGGIDARP